MRSLLALDYLNYEVVAVNDRSTDGTSEILNRLASSERLRVLHVADLPANWLGKAHAMATGLAQARGEWILFTDADGAAQEVRCDYLVGADGSRSICR